MIPRITLQLYTLRERLEIDFERTLNQIAALGFPCVEPAGYHGRKPSELAKIFTDLGLTAPSVHCRLPIGNDTEEVIEAALELGHRYLITGAPTNWRDKSSPIEQMKSIAELYCLAAENAAKYGLQIGYHNHDWDLTEINGQTTYHTFLANTPKSVLWEVDIFWTARAGIDPVDFLKAIGARGKVLHFKDGHITNQDIIPPYLPAGFGDIDLLAAAGAASHAEYIAVELDEYAGDMMDAVQKSYRYLNENKIAMGSY